ncbi:hypothetical protein ACNKHR_02115 [Shigella flexneri]
MPSLSVEVHDTEDIQQVLTQAMEDKTRGYGGQDLFCQMKHDVPLQNW